VGAQRFVFGSPPVTGYPETIRCAFEVTFSATSIVVADSPVFQEVRSQGTRVKRHRLLCTHAYRCSTLTPPTTHEKLIHLLSRAAMGAQAFKSVVARYN
jgi:hypothetical protein